MSPLIFLVVALGVLAPVSNAEQHYNEKIAIRNVLFTAASYCKNHSSVEDWSCEPCKRLKEHGVDFHVTRVVASEAHHLNGVVGWYKDSEIGGNTVLVAFRGTEPSDFRHWIIDFDGTRVPLFPVNQSSPLHHSVRHSDVYVHHGFLTAYTELKDGVRAAIKEALAASRAKQILVTGHSLGGAIATICSLDLQYDIGALEESQVEDLIGHAGVILYTFGSPRLANLNFTRLFADSIAGKNELSFRVVNREDVVPHLPLESLGYHHVLTEVFYPNSTAEYGNFKLCLTPPEGEDPTCSNSFGWAKSIRDHIFYFDVELGRMCDAPLSSTDNGKPDYTSPYDQDIELAERDFAAHMLKLSDS